ncbi:hypothetical protein GQ54DRAFT_312095 [Martensiomyces pterosporus]|nr:hypothetical protein GQ54DRAFT_312095 [Martensiomyces pterosporus]
MKTKDRTLVVVCEDRVIKAYNTRQYRDNCLGAAKVANIRVPKVLGFGEIDGWYYYIEERLEGSQLGKDEVDDELKEEMHQAMDRLRTLRFDKIGNFDANGGITTPCDMFINSFFQSQTPERYHSVAEYNQARLDACFYSAGMTKNSIEAAGFEPHVEDSFITMAHNSLYPRNIMVENGHLVGFVDWERAGAYPDSYEYAKYKYFLDDKSCCMYALDPCTGQKDKNERIIQTLADN